MESKSSSEVARPKTRNAVIEDAPWIYDCLIDMSKAPYEPCDTRCTVQGLRDTLWYEGYDFSPNRALKCQISLDPKTGERKGLLVYFYRGEPMECEPSIHANRLYVMPDARRQGHATALFAFLTEHLVEIGGCALFAKTQFENEVVAKFMAKIGMAPQKDGYVQLGLVEDLRKALNV